MSITDIARVCHDANKAYCEAHGDFSQRCWNDAETWQKQSAIAGVEFRLNNPTAPSSAQHDAWCQDKLKDGWKYGPVKDAALKEHPCLVAYEELSEVQRKKDALFQHIVDALK